MGNATVSVLLTATLFALAFSLAAVRRHVPEHDLLLSLLLTIPRIGSLTRRSPLATGATIWIALSGSVAILAGQAKPSDFLTLHGLLSIVNFSLILPIAIGVYFRFRISGEDFLRMATHSALRLIPASSAAPRHRRWYFGEGFLMVMTLLIQASIVHSELEFGLPETVWIERAGNHNSLNDYGVIHYAIRGVLVYFGLAAFAYGFSLFYKISHLDLNEYSTLYTADYQVSRRVRALGATLLIAAFSGSISVAIQGVVLFIVVSRGGANPIVVLLQSSWLLWVFITATGTIFLAGTMHRLHELLSEAKVQIAEGEMARLNETFNSPKATSPADIDPATYERFLQARLHLHQMIDGIDTSPLPGGTRGFVGAAVLQLTGIIMGIAGLVRG
ncbi:MAG: hypothetical protein HY268_03185 [Deltaproteobacteria bacterium]|nr:hypothetical protein [Deltaproteobacteria bacterium]